MSITVIPLTNNSRGAHVTHEWLQRQGLAFEAEDELSMSVHFDNLYFLAFQTTELVNGKRNTFSPWSDLEITYIAYNFYIGTSNGMRLKPNGRFDVKLVEEKQ